MIRHRFQCNLHFICLYEKPHRRGLARKTIIRLKSLYLCIYTCFIQHWAYREFMRAFCACCPAKSVSDLPSALNQRSCWRLQLRNSFFPLLFSCESFPHCKPLFALIAISRGDFFFISALYHQVKWINHALPPWLSLWNSSYLAMIKVFLHRNIK